MIGGIIVFLIVLVLVVSLLREKIPLFLMKHKDRRLEKFWIEGISDLIRVCGEENREYLLNFIQRTVEDFRGECYTNVLLGTEHSNIGVTEAFKKIVYSKQFYPTVANNGTKGFRAGYVKLIEMSYRRFVRSVKTDKPHRWFTMELLCSTDLYIRNQNSK